MRRMPLPQESLSLVRQGWRPYKKHGGIVDLNRDGVGSGWKGNIVDNVAPVLFLNSFPAA